MSGPEKCAGCDSTPAAECCYPGGYPELPIADVPDETGRRLAAHVAQARALGEARARIATLEREVERLREFVDAIARNDWVALDTMAHGLATDARASSLSDYDLRCSYDEDARYVWPTRWCLIANTACALVAHPTQTEDETDGR